MDTIIIKNNIINIMPDATSLFQSVAKDFIRRAIATITEKSCFIVVLSGGETPKFFFDALVKSAQLTSKIPWQQIKFFFGDERYVAADDPASNYHMAQQHLFSKLAIPAENIYRMPTELNDPHQVAEQYQQTLRKVFNCKENELPRFDLVYLGLGKDAHTASLMPQTELVKSYLDPAEPSSRIRRPAACPRDPGFHKDRWMPRTSRGTSAGHVLVKALWVAELKMYRITLTPPILNNSLAVHFLVNGTNKALAVWEVLKGPINPQQYPAQLIHCKHDKTVWYLDQAAAEKLRG